MSGQARSQKVGVGIGVAIMGVGVGAVVSIVQVICVRNQNFEHQILWVLSCQPFLA